jgi:hypothetical protein
VKRIRQVPHEMLACAAGSAVTTNEQGTRATDPSVCDVDVRLEYDASSCSEAQLCLNGTNYPDVFELFTAVGIRRA